MTTKNTFKNLYETDYKFSEIQIFNNYERNRLLAKVLPKYVKSGDRMLDLGCNDGVVLQHLQDHFSIEGYGFDISDKALEFAKQRGIKNLKQGDVQETLPYPNAFFDVVFWGDNIEHLLVPEFTLSEIHRVSKPGAVLIITCPNMGTIRNRINYLRSGMVPRTEGHKNAPWKWEHIRFFNFRVMTEFLSTNNYVTVGQHGAERNRFFNWLCSFCPSLFASVLLFVARKPKE